MIEIYGNESSGKSLLSLYLIASAQRQGLECALIDIEQSFDPEWAAKHGVDVDKLVFSNSFDDGEQALEYAFRLCQCGAFGVVVIDSTAALVPKSELEGSLSKEARVGAQAQLMSRGCRKIMSVIGKTNTICVFINQIRMKIGVRFGNPETTPGGRALPFYSHVRMEVRKVSKIVVKENGVDSVAGQISSVKFIKNKVARPFGQCKFRIVYDESALNPVVMLGNHLRAVKKIVVYGGLLKIEKEVLGNDKRIDTGASNMVEMADYLIENDYVIPLLDNLIEEYEYNPTLVNDHGAIDGKILEMKKDPSVIVSPSGATVDAERVDDVDESDVAEEIEIGESLGDTPDNINEIEEETGFDNI